ncbi:uncharacterized protein GLRG_03442, partial [Colletotrichum graminicola M1.001]
RVMEKAVRVHHSTQYSSRTRLKVRLCCDSFCHCVQTRKRDRKSKNITKGSPWHVYPPPPGNPTPAYMSRSKRVAVRRANKDSWKPREKLPTLFCFTNHTPPQAF